MKYGLFFRFTEPVFIPLPDPPQKGGRKKHRVVPRYQNTRIIVGFCDYSFKPHPDVGRRFGGG